jgi:ABC-2 type transport system permease protein
MNTTYDAMAIDNGPAPAPRPAPHATHKLRLLLRREFWEHKGGFFWAPLWAGGISLALTLMALVVGEVAARRAVASGKVQIDGHVMINGLDLGAISSRMDAEAMQKLAGGIDVSMFMSSLWPMMVLGFVVFFYCLGCLYDERKDRSVLFWKSLPVSDRDTVVSKAASALLVAPLLAVGASIACMFGFLVLVSVFVLLHHGNPYTLNWGPGSPLASAGLLLASIPVYALWALPTAGWLMLCSAWSKSKPFLWAIMLPVFAGIFISWFDVMNAFDLDSAWFWRNIVVHLLGGVFPGTWMDVMDLGGLRGGEVPDHLSMLKATYSTLATPQLWIGAVAGIAMLAAAVRLRRWRDEG